MKGLAYSDQLGEVDIDALEQTIIDLARAEADSHAVKRLLSIPLTPARARALAIQTNYFTLTRRDCWALAQAAVPISVKPLIWEHEREELVGKEEDGTPDHRTLGLAEGKALGVSDEDLETTPCDDGLMTCRYAWLHLARTLPWLGVLSSAAAMEITNSEEVMGERAMSHRKAAQLRDDLGLAPETLPSTAEHMKADIEHGRLLFDVIGDHVRTREDREDVLHGLRESWTIARAWRMAMANMIERIAD